MNIQNKIDFAVILNVNNANPNGDPLNGNRPRTAGGYLGEISDVCLKRKIRNRWLDMGQGIFVQSDDNSVDGYKSLKQRADGELKAEQKDEVKFREYACKKWMDVRAFGQVFAFKADKKATDDNKGVSIGIRGPVSLHPAFSVVPVNITSTQITKSVSSEGDGDKRGSDTMGMKHRVDHGVYVFYGSINPQLATKTGFSEQDAVMLKDALTKLFENDASSARPEGSMEVHKVYWWKHNCASGQYSSAKVHRTLSVTAKVEEPNGIADYEIRHSVLDGLFPDVLDGF